MCSIALACGEQASIPVPPHVRAFHTAATAGPIPYANCSAARGEPKRFVAIDFGRGGFRRVRPAEAGPYQYRLVQNLSQGLFLIVDLDSSTQYLAASFASETPRKIPSAEALQELMACTWPL
jgi:hypothetical protein